MSQSTPSFAPPKCLSRARTLAALMVAAAGLAFMAFGPLATVSGDAATQQPNKNVLDLPFKFEGATGCKDANCHGSPTPKAAPKPAGNEFLTWSEGKAGGEPDRHSKAYKTLEDKKSADIAKKLNIASATKSDLCVNCHALNAPKDKQMAAFKIEEGVTCGACHGPYEKWAESHKKEGGVNDKRTAAGYKSLDAQNMPYGPDSPEHKKLLTEIGLYDTRPILARAEKCVSCHLSIDAKLIDAGHPQPTFELAYYTELEPPHWREPAGYWGTKVWAAGQVVCLKDAMKQLADRASSGAPAPAVKAAQDQALSHLLVFKHLTGGATLAALDKAAADLKAAAGDNAKIAAAANAAMAEAQKLAPVVAGMTADEPTTAGLIAKISADAAPVTEAGIRGGEQQGLALSSLFGAYAKGKGVKNEGVNKSINEDLLGTLDPAAFKPDAYTTALKATAGKLAAVVPPTSTVANPLTNK